MQTSEQTDAFNEIIAICRDGIELYELAAERIEDPAISDLLRNMAKLRREAIGELAPLIQYKGDEVQRSGTLEGATHNFLTNIHAKLSKDELGALVGQLEALEDRTIERLQEIVEASFLPRTVPNQTWSVVRSKLELFRSTREQIISLRESL